MRTLSLFWWETLLIRRALKPVRPHLVQAWGCERGAALVASRLGYPYLVTVQGLIQWYDEQVSLGFYGKLDVFVERFSLRRAKVVTSESRFGVNWLSQHYPRLEIYQVEHAPNWIFHALERRPASQPVRFLYVGVMSRIKGTDLLLRALNDLQREFDFQLIIVGSATPSFLSELKAITSTPLWERVTMRRDLTQREVAEEMARATLMLFPSRADTSPNSVKEAVVAGLPVVASAIGGIVDYVLPDLNGLTFAAGSQAEFTLAIRAAMVHPLFSKGKVDQGTLRQMRAYLSPRLMAEKFVTAYRAAVGGGGRV